MNCEIGYKSRLEFKEAFGVAGENIIVNQGKKGGGRIAHWKCTHCTDFKIYTACKRSGLWFIDPKPENTCWDISKNCIFHGTTTVDGRIVPCAYEFHSTTKRKRFD